MIRLHIMLNNRWRFVISAVLGSLIVLLAGSANALGGLPPVTVRCVPSHTINSSCSATDYPTISAAVGVAVSGDAILVGPGTYNESVTIGNRMLSPSSVRKLEMMHGWTDTIRRGIDRGWRTGSPAFIVNANYVVIDGFTVTGGTAIRQRPLLGASLLDRQAPGTSGRKSSTTSSRGTARAFIYTCPIRQTRFSLPTPL